MKYLKILKIASSPVSHNIYMHFKSQSCFFVLFKFLHLSAILWQRLRGSRFQYFSSSSLSQSKCMARCAEEEITKNYYNLLFADSILSINCKVLIKETFFFTVSNSFKRLHVHCKYLKDKIFKLTTYTELLPGYYYPKLFFHSVQLCWTQTGSSNQLTG